MKAKILWQTEDIKSQQTDLELWNAHSPWNGWRPSTCQALPGLQTKSRSYYEFISELTSWSSLSPAKKKKKKKLHIKKKGGNSLLDFSSCYLTSLSQNSSSPCPLRRKNSYKNIYICSIYAQSIVFKWSYYLYIVSWILLSFMHYLAFKIICELKCYLPVFRLKKTILSWKFVPDHVFCPTHSKWFGKWSYSDWWIPLFFFPSHLC